MENENKKGRKKKEIGYNSVFANRLRDLMEKNKTTQPQLAEAVGVSRQAVGQWQNGNTVPDILDFQKICNFFNVSADYLLGRSESPSNDKDLKDVADYLGVSDSAAVAIRQFSGKISTEEAQKWMNENVCNTELVNGYNSSQSDICSWIITHIFYEIHYTIGVLLAQMYSNKNHIGLIIGGTTEFETTKENPEYFRMFAYFLISKMNENCKYKIDSLLSKCDEKLYPCRLFEDKHYISSIEELEKWTDFYKKMFPF